MAYTAVHVDDVEAQRGVIKFMRRELGTSASVGAVPGGGYAPRGPF